MDGASTSKDFSDSDSDPETRQEQNRKRFKNCQRRETRPQSYRDEWENTFKGWLKPVKGKFILLTILL